MKFTERFEDTIEIRQVDRPGENYIYYRLERGDVPKADDIVLGDGTHLLETHRALKRYFFSNFLRTAS